MASQEHKAPWWERPAMAPGQPSYEAQREHLRAELARAWRADDLNVVALRPERSWGGPEAPQAA